MKENSIEEDIEIVENILHKGYTMSILHPSTNIRESEIKAIEHILSDYKRVLKENEKRMHDNITLKNFISALFNDSFEKDYIPAQKIKDKIEELKEDKDSKYYDIFLEERDIENTIKILQELLEKEK